MKKNNTRLVQRSVLGVLFRTPSEVSCPKRRSKAVTERTAELIEKTRQADGCRGEALPSSPTKSSHFFFIFFFSLAPQLPLFHPGRATPPSLAPAVCPGRGAPARGRTESENRGQITAVDAGSAPRLRRRHCSPPRRPPRAPRSHGAGGAAPPPGCGRSQSSSSSSVGGGKGSMPPQG